MTFDVENTVAIEKQTIKVMEEIKEQISLLSKYFNKTLKCFSEENMVTDGCEEEGAKKTQTKDLKEEINNYVAFTLIADDKDKSDSEDFKKFNLSVSVALTRFGTKQQQSRQIWVKKGEKSLLVGYTSLKMNMVLKNLPWRWSQKEDHWKMGAESRWPFEA
ncbi:hypothetical protein Goarm_020263 [Gossypium armourianum]|uniref:Uncharacterized protein n=1 Tax=Gossypium armourianum TaxID=34283 RepID=A0A7J9IN32_9ROSI|nr:hypothetical protein [Gossypium armourianum]